MSKYNVGTILIVSFLAVLVGIKLPGLTLVQGLCIVVFGGVHGWYQAKLQSKPGDVLKFMGVYTGVLIPLILITWFILQN